MRWGEDGLRWLLLAPAVALMLLAYGHLVRRQLVARAGQHRMVRRLLASFSPERRLFKQLLIILAIGLVTVATLRPQYGQQPLPVRHTGIDVVVAFDISKSMLARDVQPSRLQGARAELERLLDGLRGHRMALVPFAGVAFTQTPLTADRSAIRLYLDALDPMQMPVGGTNLAMAIEQGVDLLTGDEDRGEKASRSRVLLLVTDGEDAAADQGEAAKAAAKRAAEAGVRIFAIAIGTRLGEPIPLVNEDGSHAGYQRDQSGKPIYSKLNLTLLEDLARLADPASPEARRVFHYDGSAPVAGEVSDALDGLQKSTLQASIRHRYGEKFQYLLLPALLLLLGEGLLGERRRPVQRRRKGAGS